MVSIISAMAERDRAIGLRGRLPWRLPADMAHFRRLTMDHALVMGRVTWEPIAKRGLPGRRVIVLTRGDTATVPGVGLAGPSDRVAAVGRAGASGDLQSDSGGGRAGVAESLGAVEYPAVHVARSLEAALRLAEPDPEPFIAGGASVYEQALSVELVDRMYLTLVQAEVEADTFFPAFDPDDWTSIEAEHHPADAENSFAMTFQILVRKASKQT